MITIALIDDHSLIRNALKELINRFDDFEVIIDVSNGQEFIEALNTIPAPNIALVDINMPVMDGFKTAHYLTENHPKIKILALTVNDDDESIIKMLRAGAVGYLLKDSETAHLRVALQEVTTKGYYHNDLVTNSLMKSIKPSSISFSRPTLTFQGREEEFLKFACTELTYKEIADRMCLSPRTVDGYRESLFDKLEIKSRVGLVLFAIKNGIVCI
ncbi:MAG: response regulator transcription factor [Emticicia sp.]|nr:response regulator transcription factor [Emticicia sp.]